MNKPTLTANVFANLLANMFVNARGEVEDGLDASRSKNAVEIRRQRFRDETAELRRLIISYRKKAEISRAKGMKLQGREREEKFNWANACLETAHDLQEKINEIAKKYNI